MFLGWVGMVGPSSSFEGIFAGTWSSIILACAWRMGGSPWDFESLPYHSNISVPQENSVLKVVLFWFSLSLELHWGWDLRDLPSRGCQIYIEASFQWTLVLSYSLVPLTQALKPTATTAEVPSHFYHSVSGNLLLFEIWPPQRLDTFFSFSDFKKFGSGRQP